MSQYSMATPAISAPSSATPVVAAGIVSAPAPVAPVIPALPDGLVVAPLHLLPPLVSGYLPSMPPPTVVDLSKQKPEQITTLALPPKTTAGEAGSLQVRKRVHPTDGVRLAARKKQAAALHHQTIPVGSTGLQIKELPDRLDINIPESGLVNQLLGLEKRLDATIARKHVEIQQALHPVPQLPQVIRLFLWHEHTTPLTHEELMNGLTNSDKPEMPSWLFKIQGQVLDANTSETTTTTQTNTGTARCLTNYLSAMIIQIETKPTTPASASAAASSAAATATPPVAPIIDTIEWRKHSAIALSDGFEIRRRGSGEISLQISLFLDYSPARFRVSPSLSHALGLPLHAPNPLPNHGQPPNPIQQPFTNMETQSNVLAAFWEYCKKKNLQDAKNPNIIRCDQTLINLFGISELPVSSALSFLQLHLSPASSEPIIIPYTIRTTIPPTPQTSLYGGGGGNSSTTAAPSPSPITCYDVLTYAPVQPNLPESYKDATTLSGLKTVQPPSLLPQAMRITEKTVELMMDVDRCNRRREFLQAFSEAPVQVMQLIVAQQAKDQLIMMGVTGVDDELERRGEYYHADWQYDAIDRMMAEDSAQAANAMQTSASMFDETPQEE